MKVASAVLLVGAALRSDPAAWCADKEKPLTVNGILIEKTGMWIEVKTDGEEKAVKYTFDASDRKLAAALKPIFTVSRVRLLYRPGAESESRRLIGIAKPRTLATGTVTGEVLAIHNNFWIEVKPKGRIPDGYALNWPPAKYKGVAETLKGLKKGDIVTLRFTSDFERHRIETLKKVKDVEKK